MTPRVLAAALANLVKANAVSKAIRYRPTEPRLFACRANLYKAIAARKADRSPTYAPSFRLGIYPISLRRSLAAAGESEAEYDAHLDLFERAFAPADDIEHKFVRAIAKVWWRRLRALRLQSRWEERQLEQELLAAVDPASKWPPEFAAEHDLHTATGVLNVFLDHLELFRKLDRLNIRLERLARVLLTWCGGSDPGLGHFSRPHACEAEMLERPETVLSNPFVSPGAVERSLESQEPSLREVWSWRWELQSGSAAFASGGAGRVSTVEEPDSSAQPPAGSEPAASPLDGFPTHIGRLAAAFQTPGTAESGTADFEIRDLAAATWGRLRIFSTHAGREAERLREILKQAACESANAGATELLTDRLLGLLGEDNELFLAVHQFNTAVQSALGRLLTKRHGASPEFEFLMVDESLDPWRARGRQFLEAVDQATKSVSDG